MEAGLIKIIQCFNITGIGLLTEIQHYENGIPPNSQIIDLDLKNIWIVKKRVFFDTLLMENAEIFFDCETKSEHISNSFKTIRDREIAIGIEIKKRKNGIYWHLISPLNKNGELKPKIDSILKIKSE